MENIELLVRRYSITNIIYLKFILMYVYSLGNSLTYFKVSLARVFMKQVRRPIIMGIDGTF